jgi:hypothetical protein
MLPILRRSLQPPRSGSEGGTAHGQQPASTPRRTDRRLGADRAALRMGGATRLGAHPSAGAEEGWLKALRLADYALRRPRQPEFLQEVLFAYTEAI